MDDSISDDDEELAIGDSIDNAILMHRDAHFGGSFDIMIDYYEKEGKGVSTSFELSRIRQLAETEARSQNNLAAMLLSGPEAEKVSRARATYKSLKEVYNQTGTKSKFPRLIADLIFSEEENPVKEMDAIVAEKGPIVPFLIDLLRSEDFHDPLFPGYGQAPVQAAKCLGRIGDKRAMISLFEAIGESDFFDEDDLLDALEAIGEPAKEFLLKVLHAKPLNFDNERAAIALIHFKDDPKVATACLEMLLDPKVWQDLQLSTYLILACEGLTNIEERQKFASLANNPAFPKFLHQDIKIIVKSWK